MASTPASMFHIVTTGLQDLERLNAPKGRPSIRFYSAVFMRRTRWASQWRRVEFDNLADFGKKATVTLPQLGELISRVILVVDMPDIYTIQQQAEAAARSTGSEFSPNTIIGPKWNWTNSIGHALCSSIELQIGDQVVDTLDSRLLEVLDEQIRPVEHFDTTNTMISRDPVAYTSTVSTKPTTLEIIPPFWFNRGPGPQVLPIQALSKDKVQITVNFRPIQQCVYTDARIDSRNPPLSGNQGLGPMPNIAACGFFQTDAATGQTIYNMTRTPVGTGFDPSLTPLGSLVPGIVMPSSYHFLDAYWIVEYISLEDREAAAFRMADLQLPIEQHLAVPPVETGGASSIRIPINEGGLVRDMTWVAQRIEAPSYNAYFLFSRDLVQPRPGLTESEIPWWPDAVIPNWDYGDGFIQPAFMTRQSDPLKAATLWYRGQRRFDHEAPSFFRSLIPALNCQRAPLIDRYIYRYDFGFWPTGGLADALTKPVDQVRGFSNWDKIPKKELDLSLDTGCGFTWAVDTTQAAVTFTDPLREIASYFSSGTQAFRVDLSGSAGPGLYGGAGATVSGILNYQQLRSLPNFSNIIARVVPGGSAALALQTFDGTSFGYQWLAVAGAGGAGTITTSGGSAAGAVSIAYQGGNAPQTQTHEDVSGTATTVLTNYIPNYTISSFFGFSSPIFTVTQPGTIYGWRVLTGLSTVALGNSITINGTFYPGPSFAAGSPSIEWHTVTLGTPIQVQSGDTIRVSHGNNSERSYNCAMNGLFAIAEITVQKAVSTLGGGGGGRGPTLAPGQPDGSAMPTTEVFILSAQQTGGSTYLANGGDGFTGGGSGSLAGGGGGSYVSRFMTGVTTNDGSSEGPSSITITPLVSVPNPKPNFTIYIWMTAYNLLRITGGRGALMFSA